MNNSKAISNSSNKTTTTKYLAKQKIRKHISRNKNKLKHNIRVNYLKTLCSDSHVCIAFGTESNKIKQFFDNFSNFKLLSAPLKRIGGDSFANGFVNELTYERDGYVSNAVLKTCNRLTEDEEDELGYPRTEDSIFYEGLAGFCLNKLGKQFTCFLETYGIYMYKYLSFYNLVKKRKIIDQKEFIDTNGNCKLMQLNHNLRYNEKFVKAACNDNESKLLAILIQYIKNAKTIDDM